MEQARAMVRELRRLADAAPDGRVLAAVEQVAERAETIPGVAGDCTGVHFRHGDGRDLRSQPRGRP
jgi:hypothetical protein